MKFFLLHLVLFYDHDLEKLMNVRRLNYFEKRKEETNSLWQMIIGKKNEYWNPANVLLSEKLWNSSLMSSISMVKRSLNYSLTQSFSYLENKQLDRHQYNLWTMRTTGEEITDDDWLSIRGEISNTCSFTHFTFQIISIWIEMKIYPKRNSCN